MELPHLLYILIGVVVAAAVIVAFAWNRHRDHALRDRFEEEYERVLREGRHDEL